MRSARSSSRAERQWLRNTTKRAKTTKKDARGNKLNAGAVFDWAVGNAILEANPAKETREPIKTLGINQGWGNWPEAFGDDILEAVQTSLLKRLRSSPHRLPQQPMKLE